MNVIQGSCIVTYRCNARCHMCNIWKHPTKPEEELDVKYYEKLPDGMRLNITGGEPMLRDDIEDIFKVLYPKARLLELSTNGYFTEKIVRLAEKFPRTLIRVSIEGLPALNDTLRGLPNGFDHALRTMLELKKTKCKNIGFSVVITDKNIKDLRSVYELCAYLGVELGNSVMHNSWYFHKSDNKVVSRDTAIQLEEEFIKTLLNSKRRGVKAKLKDYGRAYFNRSIAKRFRGGMMGYRPLCGAGEDFFFIDPWGNITPCNGSDEEWVMGNIKEQAFQEIMNSEKSKEVMGKVKRCEKNCCFIVTDRHDMVRRPWKPLSWIMKNKIRIARNLPLSGD